MKRALRISAILAGAVIVIALPFLVDGNTFRPKLESSGLTLGSLPSKNCRKLQTYGRFRQEHADILAEVDS